MNMCQWRRVNGEILRTLEYSNLLHNDIISEDAIRDFQYHNESFKQAENPRECAHCILCGTDDCDEIENPDTCSSYYSKYFDTITLLDLD